MAVTKNDSGTPNVANASATTLDLTTFTVVAASNLILIAAISIGGTPGTITVNWDALGANQPMTLIPPSGLIGPSMRVYLYQLTNPVAGTKTLRVAGIGGKPTVLGAIAFSGANGVAGGDSLGNSGTAPGTLTTGAITSSSDGATVGLTGLQGNTIDSTSTQTQVFLDNSIFQGTGLSYALGGTSNTHSWSTVHSGPWAAIGIHIIAAAPPAGGGGGQDILQSVGYIEALGNGMESGLQQPWLLMDASTGGM